MILFNSGCVATGIKKRGERGSDINLKMYLFDQLGGNARIYEYNDGMEGSGCNATPRNALVHAVNVVRDCPIEPVCHAPHHPMRKEWAVYFRHRAIQGSKQLPDMRHQRVHAISSHVTGLCEVQALSCKPDADNVVSTGKTDSKVVCEAGAHNMSATLTIRRVHANAQHVRRQDDAPLALWRRVPNQRLRRVNVK